MLQVDLNRLRPIAPREVVTAFVEAQEGARCERALASSALAPLLPLEKALADAHQAGLLEVGDGLLTARRMLASGGAAKAKRAKTGWDAAQLALAFTAVSGEDNASGAAARRRPDLAASALRLVYGLDELPQRPSKADVRCALLRRIVASLGEPFKKLAASPVKSFKLDRLSRDLYLAFAGLETGAVTLADQALLKTVFGVSSAGTAELAAAIVRLAVAKAEQPPAKVAERGFDLDEFAQEVRTLARTLETKPYAGKVAIAQVYDAGVAEGLSLGTLDDFKKHLAEAAREGLLDLERYDIAGPFDTALRERSRLRLGRDERHFIVNQWI